MPKLVSALMLAFLAWVVAGLVKQELPEWVNPGRMVAVSVVMGLICGWIILGRRAADRMGFGLATSIGLTAAVMMTFWTFLIICFNEMLGQSMDRRFDGPMEAILSIQKIGAEYGQYLFHQHIVLTILIGGAIIGVLADIAGRRWN